jgi:molybdopterin molybdotransferase
MPEFFNILPPEAAIKSLLDILEPQIEAESVLTPEALGRITSSVIISNENLPAFPRSTMDGYSVRSTDTFGASEGMPAYLDVVGEVPMGRVPKITISTGQAVTAYTGGMLADGSDAVVMIENTHTVNETTIEVVRPVAPGENVVQIGEDVLLGDLVLASGHLIRPQDIGGLIALGIEMISVARRPRVTIISTGDELVSPQSNPGHGQIRDVNSYTISALVANAGGIPVRIDIVGDDFDQQRKAALEGLNSGEMLIFSAGSSVSSRDMTARVIESLGKPGVLVHGISFKPGKPTIMALIDQKPVIGLPGNPVSAAVVFEMMAIPIIHALQGHTRPRWKATLQALLTRDLPSQTGRQDTVQVKLDQQNNKITADPIFGNSNLIYTMVRADGHVTIPINRGGLYANEEVMVTLY